VKQEDQIQEAEYDYPYHYIPDRTDGQIDLIRRWTWGLKYLGGIELMLEKLSEHQFDSLIEIGCGDGRLLAEISKAYPDKTLKGVDYSERAIRFAKAFNPDIDFTKLDITKETTTEKFDFVLLSEVLEHIELDDIPNFLQSIKKTMKPDARMLITVPHANQPVISKHFQHFTVDSLNSQIQTVFSIDEIFYFDRNTWLFRKLNRLFFNSLYAVSSKKLQNWLFKRYLEKHLKADETNCTRLGAICSLSAA